MRALHKDLGSVQSDIKSLQTQDAVLKGQIADLKSEVESNNAVTFWTGFGAVAAFVAVLVSLGALWVTYRQQQSLQILPLWEKLVNISRIDPDKADENDDARQAVNLLELVAACVDARAIKEKVAKRLCGDTFVQIADQIAQIKIMRGNKPKYPLSEDVKKYQNRWRPLDQRKGDLL
jgi:hypothetical protein